MFYEFDGFITGVQFKSRKQKYKVYTVQVYRVYIVFNLSMYFLTHVYSYPVLTYE